MKTLSIALFVLTAGLVAASAQKPATNLNGSGDLALRGYDAVAYHTDGRAVEGRREFEHRWNGARWLFASAEHRDRFAASPEQYAPQFGGYCAYAVSRGYTADIDPQAWKIVEGALYVNYSKRVQRLWEQDIPGNIAKARKNWPAVLEK